MATPPSDSVRLFVPFAPGGESDASAQTFLKSARHTGGGRRFEITYLTDEAGAAASRAVRGAPPDGRTVLLARAGSVAILPALSPRTAAAASEFTVLGVLEQAPLICAVRGASDITSMRELQRAIAASPGRLRYSAGGPGTLQSLAVRYFLSLSGLPDDAARPVHFGQGSQITQALLDGEVDFCCNSARSVVPQVQSGALRGLMTTAQGRLKSLPRLQNAAELGLRDMQQLQGWSALLGPPGMSASVVADWRALLERVADDPGWQAGVEALFAAPRIRAFRDPAQYLQQQSQFYERLVTQLGAKP